MKIVEYNVVTLEGIDGAIDAVNRRISEGWQPFGPMQVSYYDDKAERFTQTLVKYDN